MNTFRKFWQRSRKQVCAALCMICLISPQLMIYADAAEVQTRGVFSGQVFGQLWNGSGYDRSFIRNIPITAGDPNYAQGVVVELPAQNNFSTPVLSADGWGDMTGFTAGLHTFYVYPPEGVEGFHGNCALYLNWFVKLYNVPSGQYRTFDTPLYFYIYDTAGKKIDGGTVDVSFYEVEPLKGQQVTSGVSCSVKFNVPEAIPAIRVEFYGEDLGKVGWFPNDKSFRYSRNSKIEFYVPSATLIASVKTAEIEALEDVTNAIIEQNGLTQEKFTEVIGKVDEVYKELGTTNGLLEESMQQFEDWDTVTTVPGAVEDKVDKADQVISDINSLVKPDPEDIVPDMDADTSYFADIIAPYFDNFLLAQMCVLVFSFAFVSYVLFGKKG